MRTRSAGDRQDRGRPAPGGVAAVCVPRPAAAVRRARRRSQPRLPRPHRRGAARPRRGRGAPHDGRGAGRRQHPAPRSRRDRGGRPQGRRAGGRRPGAGGLGPRPVRHRAPRRAPRRPEVAGTRIRRHRGSRGAARADDPLRGGAAGAPAAAGAPRPARDGAQWRLAGRPGPGLGRPVRGGARLRGDGVAEARPAAGAVRPALVGRDAGRARRRAPDARRAGAAALADAAAVQGRRPVVGRGPGAPRRAGRPPRADAEPGPRRPRRGPGPVADAAARGRAPLLDRFGHGPRRHRPGDDSVGDRLVGVVAGAPREAGRPHRGPGPRVPGAGLGDRLRRAPAALDGTWAGRAGVGSGEPGPAGPGPRAAGGRRGRGGGGRGAPHRGAGLGRRDRAGLLGHGGVGVVDHGRHRARCARRRPRGRRPPGRRGPGHRGEGPRVRPGGRRRTRRPSPRTNRTNGPVCGGSTSCSPEPSRS